MQVGMVTAVEKGLLAPVLGIIEADENIIPPVMVFSLAKVPPTYLMQSECDLIRDFPSEFNHWFRMDTQDNCQATR